MAFLFVTRNCNAAFVFDKSFEVSSKFTDLFTEDAESMTEAAKAKRVNSCTVWRWANKGVENILLGTVTK